jgi:multidrug transporter EmrE-like cation transporter
MSKSSDPSGPFRPGAHPAMLPARPPVPSREVRETPRPGHEDTSRQAGRPHLTIGNVALVLFAVTTAAIGQVMLKHGMQVASSRAAHSHGSLAVSAATSPWVLLGLLVFGISAIAWLAALSRVPLSVAYPFNALGYLGILTASILVLHERANILTWLGSLLVVSGLVIVVLARP